MGKIGVFVRLILIVLRALWLKKNIYFLILIISLSVSLEIVSEIKDPITHPVLRGSNAEWNMLVGRLKSNRLCYSSGLHLCEEGFKMHWDNEPKYASKLWRPNKIKGVLTPRSPDPDLALSWRLKKITLLAWQVSMCFSSSHSDDMQVCSQWDTKKHKKTIKCFHAAVSVQTCDCELIKVVTGCSRHSKSH